MDDDLRQPLLATAEQPQQLDQQQQPRQQQQQQGRGGSGGGSDGGSSSSGRRLSTARHALLLCIPTCFDLAATTLMNVGLLYVAASGGAMLA
jgi:hypothetical protein